MIYRKILAGAVIVTMLSFTVGCSSKKTAQSNTNNVVSQKQSTQQTQVSTSQNQEIQQTQGSNLQSTPPQNGVIDVTKILTKEEVESITKTKMNSPELKDTHNSLGQKNYIFKSVAPNAMFVQTSLMQDAQMGAQAKTSGQSVRKMFEATKKMMPKKLDVSGLGYSAYCSGNNVYILKGTVYVIVTITSKTSDAKQMFVAVAEKIGKRI